jgi:hypothetical protein
MAMATNAVIVHQIPGRARLLVRDRRGDPAYFSGLSESFSRFDNVRNARANPTTGSLILEFTGELEALLKQAEDTDLLDIAQAVLPETRPPARFHPKGPPLNLVSGRDVDRMFIVGCALLAIGAIQTIRGEWFPPAVSVFWMAATAFGIAAKQQGLAQA